MNLKRFPYRKVLKVVTQEKPHYAIIEHLECGHELVFASGNCITPITWEMASDGVLLATKRRCFKCEPKL